MLIPNHKPNKAEIIEALEQNVIWSCLVSDSKSGLTRKLRFYTITNGGINDITLLIAKHLQLNYNDSSITVKGDGMHMGVYVVQKVSDYLFNNCHIIKHRDL